MIYSIIAILRTDLEYANTIEKDSFSNTNSLKICTHMTTKFRIVGYILTIYMQN